MQLWDFGLLHLYPCCELDYAWSSNFGAPLLDQDFADFTVFLSLEAIVGQDHRGCFLYTGRVDAERRWLRHCVSFGR